jgi:uncharacterized protein (TIGR02996 family)
MTPEEAFLQAVLDSPDDDTPRLVYADWLDDHADRLPGRDPQEVRARAEFIRLQIAAEGHDDDPDFDPHRERALAHWSRYGKQWSPPPPDGEPEWRGWWCRRGFAEHVELPPARLPDLASLFALAPVRSLFVWVGPDEVRAVAGCPHLRRIRALRLSGAGLSRDDARRLLTSPQLDGLVKLQTGSLGGDQAAELVSTSPSLAGLRSLEFMQDRITPAGAEALARSPALRPRRLRFDCGEIGDAGLGALAGSPFVGRLEALALPSCGIGPDGARALGESPHLGPLWSLDLFGSEIGPEGAVALAGCRRLAGLRVLNLDRGGVGADGLGVRGSPATRCRVPSARRS